ncbi:unnamed protein product [Polarella glacialis]|uniref:Uncharacterized protein n=1 Tax=Polarella glacialis TaxID=89957 RepID=A0A813DC54_POLGL|nr:unnamed protein product [Polarella glacialis]
MKIIQRAACLVVGFGLTGIWWIAQWPELADKRSSRQQGDPSALDSRIESLEAHLRDYSARASRQDHIIQNLQQLVGASGKTQPPSTAQALADTDRSNPEAVEDVTETNSWQSQVCDKKGPYYKGALVALCTGPTEPMDSLWQDGVRLLGVDPLEQNFGREAGRTASEDLGG